MTYEIVGIGNALVDTEIHVTENDLEQLSIDKGLMTLCDEQQQKHYIQHLREHIDSAHRASGGSAANSLIAASQLGSKAHMTCRVANDEDGDFFLNDMKRCGVDYNLEGQQVDGTTGKCLVMVTPDADRTMNTALGVSADLAPENIPSNLLESANFLYIEGYLATSETGMAAAISMRELAERHNVKICMSLSDPGIVEFFTLQLRAIMGDKAHLIFCNEAEAMKWTTTEHLEDALELLKVDSDCFVVTLGAKGAICYDGSELIEVKAPTVDAIDTNGAGDMFAGTFLSAISQGKSYAEAGELACLGASEVVKKMGPRLDVTGYQKLKSLL